MNIPSFYSKLHLYPQPPSIYQLPISNFGTSGISHLLPTVLLPPGPKLGGTSCSLVPHVLSAGPSVSSSVPPSRKKLCCNQFFSYASPFSVADWM